MGSLGTRVWVAVVGDRGDHSTDVFEGGASDIANGGVESAEHEFGARKIDGAADQRVDDFHDGGLNGFAVFKKSDMVEARVRAFDGAEHALVEVAELLSAKSWGATTDSGDLDVRANFDFVLSCHVGPIDITYFFVVFG